MIHRLDLIAKYDNVLHDLYYARDGIERGPRKISIYLDKLDSTTYILRELHDTVTLNGWRATPDGKVFAEAIMQPEDFKDLSQVLLIAAGEVRRKLDEIQCG